ncbi:MAG TPA: hypothetical protein VF317_06310 [Dermatophilaceae bacterium]
MGGSWHKVKVSPEMLVSFKVIERGGRCVITELHVVGGSLTAGLLRTLPLARIEQLVNADASYLERSRVKWATGQPEPTLADLRLPTGDLHLGDSGDGTETGQVVEATAELVSTGAITAAVQRPKLERPDGTDPAGFYQRVADAYRDTIRSTPRVTDALAAEAGVPTGTSRRWLMEARRRGFLPPAKRSRA